MCEARSLRSLESCDGSSPRFVVCEEVPVMINALFALCGHMVHTNHFDNYSRLVPKCYLAGWPMLSVSICAA